MAIERPDDPSPMIDIGDIMRSQENYPEAVLAYESALSRLTDVTENYWSLHYALGISLERTHNWPRAEENFKKALELRPDQPYVLNYLAYSWVEKGINLDQATEMLRNARDQRPNDAYIIDSVGWVHYQLGSYEEAVVDLEDAVELLPQDPIVNDHLGDAYWQVGRKREARFQWKRALSMDPEPDTIPAIEEKIKNGLKAPQAKTSGDGNS
jgi:Flp pilus assembly protein TadD